MKSFTLLILPLVLAALACEAGSAPAALVANPTDVRSSTLTPTPSAMADHLEGEEMADPTPGPERNVSVETFCEVRTGYPGGRAFLRSGPGRSTRSLGVVYEGDLLTLILSTPTPTGAAWRPVQAGELQGWIFAELCEVKP